jgi:urea transporter
MITLNNKAQVFVMISTALGIVVGIALNAQWRSWGAYAGSSALLAIDLAYRAMHPSTDGKPRLIAPDSGGTFFGTLPAWVMGGAFLALFLFLDHGIAARRALTPSAVESPRPSLHAS